MSRNTHTAVRKARPSGKASGLPVLWADSARDLMTPDPVSIRHTATIREAAALLTDRGFGAVPVIDDGGRPIGVLSRTDIVRYDREHTATASPSAPAQERTASGERVGEGFLIEETEAPLVREIMTPMVLAVDPATPASDVVAEMIKSRVHRLFVVDGSGALIGVISAFDVVRHLKG
jgi:CBS domain-containing protein